MRRRAWWTGVRREGASALRQMGRNRGFAAVVVLTLGLGIGAATSIFSVVDGVIFRPLPYEEPEALVEVWETYPHWRGREGLDPYWDRIGLSWPDYVRWRGGQRMWSGVAAYHGTWATVTGGEAPERVRVGAGTSSFFPLLDVPAARGRTFLPGEDGEGAVRVAVLSHGFRERRFGAEADVLGTSVTLDGQVFTIVGVLPGDFRFPALEGEEPSLWVPLGALGEYLEEGNHGFRGVARLAVGGTIEGARAETGTLLRGDRPAERLGVRLVGLQEAVVGEARPPLLLLLAASGLLLVIACVNVGALVVGEGARREREFVTRLALGAGTWRVVRQHLLEILALALLAGGVGVALAFAGTEALVRLAPAGIPRLDTVSVDVRILGFAVAVSVFTGLACAAAPTLALTRLGDTEVLRAGGGHTGRRGTGRHAWIVGAELAVLMILLTVAGLLAGSLVQTQAVDPGFRAGGLLAARVELPETRYPDAAGTADFYARLMERLREEPGIVRAAGVSIAPFTGGGGTTSVRPEGHPGDQPAPEAGRREVLGGYLETLGVPVLAGRTFEPSEMRGDPVAVLVSESLARRLWPATSAVGRRLEYRDRWFDVVGVVGDVRDHDLTRAPEPTFYLPHAAAPDASRAMWLLLDSRAGAGDGLSVLRRVLAALDPALPVAEVASLDELRSRSLATRRYRAVVVNAFAAAALLLAAVGIFGVSMRAVRRRRRDLGVRIALGAAPGRLVGGVLGTTVGGGALGILAGGLAAALLAPALSRFLFGVSPRDPVTFALAALLLLLVAALASGLPAYRASRTDPVRVLAPD